MAYKPLVWVGTSLDRLRAFPPDAKRMAGFELRRVQSGLNPGDWRPLHSMGQGVAEIRIHTGLEHRVVYVAKFRDAVYVLHAFEKRTRRTSRGDLALISDRNRQLLRLRAALGRPR